jgi:SAM-dependent methyltransferase
MTRTNFNPSLGNSLRKKGIWKFVFQGMKFIQEYIYYRFFKRGKFRFNGKLYNYFYYHYNATWRNERAVEIPLIWEEVKKNDPSKVLEVGNVLGHYFKVKHEVLDKYEKLPGIINKDIVDLKTDKRYDLIVTISTLEHVGWDEEPRDLGKVARGIKNLAKHLSKGGKLIFTIPIDYNPHLDKMIKKGEIELDEVYFLKRISKDNHWAQVDLEGIKGAKFEDPFPRANGLIVGILNN